MDLESGNQRSGRSLIGRAVDGYRRGYERQRRDSRRRFDPKLPLSTVTTVTVVAYFIGTFGVLLLYPILAPESFYVWAFLYMLYLLLPCAFFYWMRWGVNGLLKALRYNLALGAFYGMCQPLYHLQPYSLVSTCGLILEGTLAGAVATLCSLPVYLLLVRQQDRRRINRN